LPQFYWIECPACGWGTVVDTETFQMWFKIPPKKVLSEGWKIWCPHCKGSAGRKPLAVVSLGKGGREIGEWVFRLKKTGAYSLLVRTRRGFRLTVTQEHPPGADIRLTHQAPKNHKFPKKICSACGKVIEEKGLELEGKLYHASCLAEIIGKRIEERALREKEREEIRRSLWECIKNWKRLLQSPLTSPNEQEKIDELTQSLQLILEKYQDPSHQLSPQVIQKIITTARVRDLLVNFFSQPEEKRKRTLNSLRSYGPLKELIEDVCCWCSEKERRKAGFLISLVVKTALDGLRKKERPVTRRSKHSKVPPWYEGKGELRHELIGKHP
jgi:hypothetical protein